MNAKPTLNIAQLNERGRQCLPDLFGIQFLHIEWGRLTSGPQIQPQFLAPNGYLHAATLIALADTACGYGCISHLPDNANSFTTAELKSNFLSTATEGVLHCEAVASHLGRSTHIWDASVTSASNGKTLALFRCTQLILYPKS